MKPKLSKIPKALRAQGESIHGRQFANQSTPLDLMRLAKETLPNASLLRQNSGFLSMKSFGPTSNLPIRLFLSFAKDPDDTNEEQIE